MIGLLLLVAAAAHGYGTETFNAFSDGPPPERYHHNTSVVLHITDQAHVAAACSDPNDTDVVGCGDVPLTPIGWHHIRNVYMLDPCGFHEVYAQRLCHELAHTNGWPVSHPR